MSNVHGMIRSAYTYDTDAVSKDTAFNAMPAVYRDWETSQSK